MDVFWEKGFEASSISDLLAALDISRSSFYEAFGSKRDLLLAAVRHYCSMNRDKFTDIVADAATPRAAIHGILALVANGGGEKGCLLVNCITELAPHDADVRAIASNQGDWVEDKLTTLISQGRGGEARPADPITARAMVSLAYGATLMRKSGMDEAGARKLLETGEAMLD